jgi:hypothetical protein
MLHHQGKRCLFTHIEHQGADESLERGVLRQFDANKTKRLLGKLREIRAVVHYLALNLYRDEHGPKVGQQVQTVKFIKMYERPGITDNIESGLTHGRAGPTPHLGG